MTKYVCSLNTGCQDLGGYNDWGTPVPIPNTEVKPVRADGTAFRKCGRVGSCQDFDIKSRKETENGEMRVEV